MSLATRLTKLGVMVSEKTSPRSFSQPFNEDDWLVQFTVWGQQGGFTHEPDFDRALALLRDKLAIARTSLVPPFDPPSAFQTQELPPLREENWRCYVRFPGLAGALGWLQEMRSRVMFGVPPVSEEEYRELESWFLSHEPALTKIAEAEDGLHVGTRRLWCWQVRFGLRTGSRGECSGQTAEEMRQIRAGYGDRVTPTLATLTHISITRSGD